jgi:hypothetical protein
MSVFEDDDGFVAECDICGDFSRSYDTENQAAAALRSHKTRSECSEDYTSDSRADPEPGDQGDEEGEGEQSDDGSSSSNSTGSKGLSGSMALVIAGVFALVLMVFLSSQGSESNSDGSEGSESVDDGSSSDEVKSGGVSLVE